MSVVVLSTVVLGIGLVAWYLVSARRRRENQRAVSPQWLSDLEYPKNGDRPR